MRGESVSIILHSAVIGQIMTLAVTLAMPGRSTTTGFDRPGRHERRVYLEREACGGDCTLKTDNAASS